MKVEMDPLTLEVGGRLRQRRKTLGIPQEQLAALAGVAVHTLSNLESGKGNPSLRVLGKLFDCLGLELFVRPRRTAGDGLASEIETL